jgi:hypothetical protein
MTEQEVEIIKGIVAKLNAVEKTLLESNFREQYLNNLQKAKADLGSTIGEAYLKSLFDHSADGEAPHEQ